MSDPTELIHWARQQINRGCSQDSLSKAMIASGYQADFTKAFLQNFPHVAQQAAAATLSSPANSPVLALPEPDLLSAPSHIQLPDRRVEVLANLRLPRIVVFGNVASHDECQALIALSRHRLIRSETVEPQSGNSAVHEARTSEGMFFERGESALIQTLELRIAHLLQWPVEHGEDLQILHYGVGGEYKPHYDYFDPEDPGSASHLTRGGNRLATLILYLNTPIQGGGTVFPDAQLEVTPREGNAVFFSYDRPSPQTRSLHGGLPVLAGEKWIATKWLRESVFV